MSSERMIRVDCPMIAQAPDDASYFFGFHDVTPWAPDDRRMLMLRIDPSLDRMPNGKDVAEVVLWTPEEERLETVGETTCWNFQQGARAMWMPGVKPVLCFNRDVDGAPGTEIVDLDSGTRRTLPHGIGSIAPCGSYALSPHFGRLGHDWPAYGYAGYDAPGLDALAPDTDGLWRLDLETGETSLVVSIAALAAFNNTTYPPGTRHFVSHVSFNRAGTRIVFMQRFFSRDHASFSRFFSARPDGTDLVLMAEEKVSHFDWLDDETIVVWMRAGSARLAAARRTGLLSSPLIQPAVHLARKFKGRLKGALLRESYYVMPVTNPAAKQPFHPELFPADGHPMVSPDGQWIVTDIYPDSRNGMDLMLYDRWRKRRIDVARFDHDIGTDNSDLKCDLHPRWDRSGKRVAVDAPVKGRRRLTVFDVSSALEG